MPQVQGLTSVPSHAVLRMNTLSQNSVDKVLFTRECTRNILDTRKSHDTRGRIHFYSVNLWAGVTGDVVVGLIGWLLYDIAIFRELFVLGQLCGLSVASKQNLCLQKVDSSALWGKWRTLVENHVSMEMDWKWRAECKAFLCSHM